uniref:HTH CENPB-type domain-containing protein n=1 Tax=Trichuris muris TaxID=70415 RepID=A0A5S6QPE0_TRIMR
MQASFAKENLTVKLVPVNIAPVKLAPSSRPRQVGSRQVGSRQDGSRQVGSRQVGSRQDSSRQVGPVKFAPVKSTPSSWLPSRWRRQVGPVKMERFVYEHLRSIGEVSEQKEFKASKGWLASYAKRYNLKNLKVTGEAA